MDLTLLLKHKSFFLSGTLVTLQLTMAALVVGMLLGLIAGMGRISRNPLARFAASVYVTVIRGTPMLLQIFYIFFGIPQLYKFITGAGLSMNPLTAGVIALGINSGAYVAEIVRAGIQSIEKGQIEAARSLGLSQRQAMRHIILPQAFRRIIPPLGNEFIVLLKDSSLVSAIGAAEVMYSAKVMGARYYDYLQFLNGAAIIYLTMTFAISQFIAHLERRLVIND